MHSWPGQIDETVDPAKEVIVADMPLKAEAVEQRLLDHPPLAHHRPNLLRFEGQKQAGAPLVRVYSGSCVSGGLSIDIQVIA
jgi:hypothetical protein